MFFIVLSLSSPTSLLMPREIYTHGANIVLDFFSAKIFTHKIFQTAAIQQSPPACHGERTLGRQRRSKLFFGQGNANAKVRQIFLRILAQFSRIFEQDFFRQRMYLSTVRTRTPGNGFIYLQNLFILLVDSHAISIKEHNQTKYNLTHNNGELNKWVQFTQ